MSRSRLFHPNFPFAPRKVPFFYGWVIVGASIVGISSSIPGQTVGVGPFTEYLLEALGLTRMQLAAAYMVGTVGGGLLLPKVGGVFDRFGARPLGVFSQVAFALALFYIASCDHIYHALHPADVHWPWLAFGLISLGFFLIRFIGQGVVTLTARALIGKWFNRRRGLASAINGSFTALLFGGSPAFLFWMIEANGWRETWIIGGFYMLLFMTVICWLIYRDNPEECGLMMDGCDTPPEPSGKMDPELVIHRDFTADEAVRSYSFWVFTAAFCLNGIYATAFGFHAEDIARESGVTAAYFFGLFPKMTLINIPFGFIIGWLTGRVRLRYCLSLMAAAMALSAAGLIGFPSDYGVIAFLVGGGISWACFGTLMAVVYPRFFGRKHLGKISGWSMLALVLASAVSPLLWSISQWLTAAYAPANWCFVAACGILFILSFRAENPQRKFGEVNPTPSH